MDQQIMQSIPIIIPIYNLTVCIKGLAAHQNQEEIL